MKINKKVIAELEKCYSIAGLKYNDKDYFLVAAEKHDPCLLFDLDGNVVDVVWEEPGGVMSMVQIPKSNGQFLAIHKFYSPNDSKEARIVIVTPREDKTWEVRTLVELPHVHRFDIVSRNGVNYIIACTLKSGHEYKDDWTMPGKVYAAVLPSDLAEFNQDNQLEMSVVKDDMLKNHGYYRVEGEQQAAIIACDNGVYQFIPPISIDAEWEIQTMLETPASDVVLLDLDGDEEKELVVLSPFHGSQISIYKKINGEYKKVYDYDKETEFLHAIYGGDLCGTPTVVIGHRQGERNLIAFTYNVELKIYEVNVIDENCGSANVYKFTDNGNDYIVAANREIDEVAMYLIEK